MNEEEYLQQRVYDQIDWYDRKSQWNQKWFKRLQVFQLVASVSIPFLSGYVELGGFWIKFSIGFLGVSIAGTVAIAGLYKFQENWIEYRTTCETLRHEKFRYLTKTEPYDSEERLPLLVERIESLISKENSNWSQYIKKRKEK